MLRAFVDAVQRTYPSLLAPFRSPFARECEIKPVASTYIYIREFVLPRQYFTKTFNRGLSSHSRDHSNRAISARGFAAIVVR